MGSICNNCLNPDRERRQLLQFVGDAPVKRDFRRCFYLSEEQLADILEHKGHQIVRVMSYNILADRLSSLPKFKQYVPSVVRDFEFRSRRIIGEIFNAKADLVCLQEVDNFNEFYREQLDLHGYQTIFKPKTAPEYEQQHGIAISFKTDVFALITHKWVDMNQMMLDFCSDTVLLKDNQALFVLLRHLPSQRYLVVGNTHLYNNPEFDYVKHAQAIFLLRQASTFMRDSVVQIGLIDPQFAELRETTIPFLFGGDFNSQPVSSAMSVFHSEDIQGECEWQIPMFATDKAREFYNRSNEIYKEWKSQGLFEPLDARLNSAYNLYYQQSEVDSSEEVSFETMQKAIKKQLGQHLTRSSLQPEHTNYTQTFKGTLDHLLHNEKLLPLELLEIPDEMTELAYETALPSTLFPSDHVRIEGRFFLC